ncbi:hypothetical protein HELRODRAFT_191655 [Helobdella robusta]|uniref:RING-type domain-containing protein n=1 Tax=Helobdella robusta TaxID=6412 RepID=T1FT65_HELRO|nr:hypothetical protein HELRODRAFT_191655 [Helobdella robusta]ESO04620.1 hypothetical protein HELRODRAFT_191655 [Helobdella robusta]
MNNSLEASSSTYTSTVILTDEFLHCPNCTQELVRPKLLPCLHSFCCDCLETCLSSNGILPGQTFYCPLCRTHCTVPESGVQEMKDNVLVGSMQSFLNFRNDILISDEVTCGGCGKRSLDKTKVKKCIECSDWLCRSCSRIHQQVKLSKDHHQYSSEELLTGDFDDVIKENISSHYCPKHKEKLIKYCLETKCKALLCEMCIITSHSNHDVIPITQQAIKDSETIQLFLPLVEKFISTLQMRIKNLASQQKDVTRFRKTFHKTFGDRVLKVIEKITEKLYNYSVSLHNSVDGLTGDRLEYINSFDVEDLKSKLETAKISNQFCEQLIKFDHTASILNTSGLARSQLKKFQKCPKMKISSWTTYSLTEPVGVTLDVIAYLVGGVYCDDKPKNDTSVLSFNTKSELDVRPCVMCDLAIDHSNSSVIVVDESNKNLKVFDFEGNRLTRSADGFFHSPIRITVLRNNDNYLVNDENTLKLSSKQFTSLQLFTSYKFKQPVGICQSTNGEILVAEWMTGEVLGFDEIGNIVRKFPCLSKNPAYLSCCLECDHLIVSDWKTHRIRVFHWNGNLIGTFGSTQGSDIDQLDHPHGVSSDSENRIIVCDSWNNRLLLLNWKGRFIGNLLTNKEGLRWPQASALTKNYLFVVERSGIVKLFEYNPVTNS